MQPIWHQSLYFLSSYTVYPIFGLVLVTIIKHEDKSLLINEASVSYTVGQMRQT